MEQIINTYYTNNAKKLHLMVDKILKKFGGITEKDYDDFYSLANEVFVDVIKSYDKEQSFDGFLYSCLSNKVKTEITTRNRYKRKADRMSISIYTPIGEDEGLTLGDMLADKNSVEDILLDDNRQFIDEKIETYINSLSNIQRSIIELKMMGVERQKIMEVLHMSNKEYDNNFVAMRSFEKTMVLFR